MALLVAQHCDLRVAFGPGRDQGNRPTCLAFALSDVHGAARAKMEVMSAEHLYFHAVLRSAGRHPDDGVTVPEACDALRLDGQSLESGWPYLAALPSDLAQWKPPATAAPLIRCATQLATATVGDIMSRLDAKQPVVLILLLGERFYNLSGGIVVPGPNDADVDYHAVIAVGHGKNAATEDFILVRNSWGEDWGCGGYAWIAASYLKTRLIDALVVKAETTP